MILARPFTAEARTKPQPARLLVAALAIGLPLIWFSQPQVAKDGKYTASLRFEHDLKNFGEVEAALVRKQTDILTFQPNVRVSRQEVAKRLRDEVLAPWREASKPLLQAASLPQDGSRSARVQAAMRDYVRAREEFLTLRILSLETADPSDEARALSADHRLDQTQNVIDVLARE